MPSAPTLEEMQAADQAFTGPSPGELRQADNEFHISKADPKKLAAYTQFAQRLSRTAPLGIGEHAAATRIPEEDRDLFAAIAERQYNADQSMKKVGYGTRLATSVVQGAIDYGMPVAKMVGAIPKLTPDQERYKQQLQGIRQSTDPTIQPDTNWLGRGVQQTGQMAFPMVQSVGAAKALGGAAKFLGWAPKAVAAAQAAGVTASFLPQTADQTYTSLIGEGVDEGRARAITAVSAPIEAAIESIIPDPFTGYASAFRGTARQVATKLIKQYTVNFTKELTEEGLQGIVNEAALEVGRMMDEKIPDKGFGNILQRGVNEMQQAAVPLALMVAPGAAIEGTQVAQQSAARAERLAQLKQVRAKGYVSAEDGQLAGVPGETRKERLTNADAEIKQLEQEIQNAAQAPEVQQPEVPQEVQTQAPVQQAAEVPEVPVAPPPAAVPPPPAAPPPVDERQAMLDALGAAEAAAPEQPKQSAIDTHFENLGVKSPESRQNNLDAMKSSIESAAKGGRLSVFAQPGQASEKDVAKFDAFRELAGQMGYEIGPQDYTTDKTTGYLSAPVKQVAATSRPPESQPKRDVSAEIRDALTKGKVTVSTPNVPGGFPVKKVRENGDVMGRSGQWITPDETWVINPPKPATAPQQAVATPPAAVQPEPVPSQEVVQPGKEVPNGQKQEEEGQRRKGLLTPQTPQSEPTAAGEVPITAPAAPSVPPVEPEHEPYKPPYSSDEVRRAQKTAEAARKRFGKRSGPMVPPPIRAEISGKISEQEGRVDDMKEANAKYHEEYRQRAEAKAAEPTQPAVEKPVEQPEFSLARGKKIEPAAPNPELEKAGIKLKATPKGWSVTGLKDISKDDENGLRTDYGARRTETGFRFTKDPTESLVSIAGKIAAENEQVAAAKASGLVRTRVGTLTPEAAEYFEQTSAERLKLAKEELQRHNDSKDELLANVIPTATRGEWKLNLMRVAAKGGDETNIPDFDLLVQYSENHTELGLPTEGHKLFRLLAEEAFTKSDAELSDEIDSELAAEIEAELGDASFDFGANEAEPETKQTIIPGTEEAVASLERREESKDARKAMAAQAKPKGKQTKFIRDQGDDLPGQKTAFATDAMEPESAADVNPLRSSLQQAADDAAQEVKDAEDDLKKLLKKKGSSPTALLDPEIAAAAGRVVVKYVKAGTLKFAAMIEQLAKSIGQAAVDRIRPALEAEWDRIYATKEYPKMEQRTPESQAEPVPPSGDDLTSIKKEVVNDLRALVGLPEMEGSTAQTVEEWAERARITLAADPRAAIRLVNELANSTRAITQSDVMLLQFRYRQLANELAPVVDEYFAAKKSGEPVAIATAKTALVNARKSMTDFEETIHPSKETWGRTGVALQQMLRNDFSIESVLRRGQEANDGEELSPDQTAELTAMAKKFQDLQTQFEAQRKKTDELEAELASKRQHEEAVTEVKREKVNRKSDKRAAAEKKVADAWEKFRQVMTMPSASGAAQIGAAVDVAKAYFELGYRRFAEFMAAVRKNAPDADKKLFREAWDQATAGQETEKLDPTDREEISKAAREIQRELVEAGMTDRDQVIDAVHEALQEEVPELTRRQTMDALSRYGIFQRQSQDEIEKLIRGMNSEILKLSQIDQMETAMKRVDSMRAEGKTDEEIGKALADEKLLVEATGLVRDRPSQTVRQLTQKYNELKKSIPATPANKAGMLQTTLNQMERALRNRISDLKFEIDRKEKVVKEKRERPTSETVKALQAERDALVAIHKEMFPAKKPSEAQRIASAIRGSDKAIAALEKQIASQDFDVEAKPQLSSPALDARRARLEQLRAHRKALKAMEVARMEGEGGKPTGKVPLSDAELARRAYESSLKSRIADYKDLLAKGDFSPQPKKQPRTLTESELKLRREMEDVRHEVLQKYADYHLANLKGIAWGADKISEAAHLSRAILTSFDLSSLGRQGGLVAAGHPVLAKRALLGTIASIAHTFDPQAVGKDFKLSEAEKFLTGIDSRKAEFDFMHKLNEGPAGELRQKAGLDLPGTDQSITKQEEAFQGRWGKLVPGISISSRLYTMILNKLRADLFDSMVQNLGRNGQVTMDEAKVIASFVNVATGRSQLQGLKGVPIVGLLAQMESASHYLNTVFFAPRYVASRFQYLAMPFYLPFQGGLNANWRVKKAIYKEYSRTAVGMGTVLGAFALLGKLLFDDDDEGNPLVSVELDPRSSDFLKVRIGETRLDFLAGLAQVFVLNARMASFGTKSSVTGNVKTFYKDRGADGQPITHASVLLHFLRSKLAPVPGAVATVASGMENIVGQKETPASLVGSLGLPLSVKDISTTIETQGIPAGTAMSLLSVLGVGLSTYGPRTEYVTGTPEERQAQIEKDLKNMQWDDPEQPAYSEFLTSDQLEKFRQRSREKKGLVVYQATYAGKNEDEIKTRDKNREYLDSMGVSKDEALQLLKDYYKSKEGGLRVKGETGLKEGYVRKLGALNSIYGK